VVHIVSHFLCTGIIEVLAAPLGERLTWASAGGANGATASTASISVRITLILGFLPF
jgi:hypothetical protein